nr:hypothetical protein [Rhizobium sp. P32RR-XVIII]
MALHIILTNIIAPLFAFSLSLMWKAWNERAAAASLVRHSGAACRPVGLAYAGTAQSGDPVAFNSPADADQSLPRRLLFLGRYCRLRQGSTLEADHRAPYDEQALLSARGPFRVVSSQCFIKERQTRRIMRESSSNSRSPTSSWPD